MAVDIVGYIKRIHFTTYDVTHPPYGLLIFIYIYIYKIFASCAWPNGNNQVIYTTHDIFKVAVDQSDAGTHRNGLRDIISPIANLTRRPVLNGAVVFFTCVSCVPKHAAVMCRFFRIVCKFVGRNKFLRDYGCTLF